MKIVKTLVAVAAAAVATVALAAVNYDGTVGGFAGKGDVMMVLGLTNQEITANADNVKFFAKETVTYSGVCNFMTGPTFNRVPHSPTRVSDADVQANVVAADRRNKNESLTGFNLSPLSNVIVIGDAVPVNGEPCQPNDSASYWSDVQKVQATGELFVSFTGGAKVYLASYSLPVAP